LLQLRIDVCKGERTTICVLGGGGGCQEGTIPEEKRGGWGMKWNFCGGKNCLKVLGYQVEIRGSSSCVSRLPNPQGQHPEEGSRSGMMTRRKKYTEGNFCQRGESREKMG